MIFSLVEEVEFAAIVDKSDGIDRDSVPRNASLPWLGWISFQCLVS